MAFLKYADAIVRNPNLEPKAWNSMRAAATAVRVPVSSILEDFSPEKYLLTHATIVASVDVEDNDYYIKPDCSQYVNQNGDCWERQLLMASYPTFIGAYNYLEHVQIPALSKGRIIDAVARSVSNNNSVYIDILVATERKHRELVASIEGGNISTLSMGCSIKYSICSACGNKAADETELCDHIRYMKNSYFVDENGVKRIIAELCGHRDEKDSNVFIEASWVANPAFKGAVMRNILFPKDSLENVEVANKIEASYVLKKVEENSLDAYLKAASLRKAVEDPMDFPSKDEEDLVKPEQAQPEQAQPEQVQPEQAQPEQAQPEQAQPEQAQPEQAQPEQAQPEQAQPEQAQPEQAQPEQAQPEQAQPEQAQPEQAQPEQAQPDQAQPDQAQPEQAQPEQAQPEQAQPEQAQPEQAQPEQAQPEQAQPEQAQPEQAQPEQAQPEEDSFDGVINKVKKEIRQQVIDELQKELSDSITTKTPDFSDSDKLNQGWNTNDNLVKAFIEIYQPKTGFSKAKLASIFKMVEAYENNKNIVKLAHSSRDLIDFFEFVDTFQLNPKSLKKSHYNILRKASSENLSSFDSFLNFIASNGISDNAVINSILARAKFIREKFKDDNR
jgi:hypothetical protein